MVMSIDPWLAETADEMHFVDNVSIETTIRQIQLLIGGTTAVSNIYFRSASAVLVSPSVCIPPRCG
jgi:hypothetical protein